jgi:hypothetical protein
MLPFVALAFAACDLSTAPEVRDQAQDLEQVAQWSSSIAGTSSAISGSLQIREFGSYGEATITISGAQASRSYQWRIFRGHCSDADPDLHATIQSYPDLVTDGSGAASVARTLGGALNTPAGEYSVRLRVATTTTNWDGSAAIACGDLQKS